MNPIISRPQMLPANGDITLANKSPIPEPWIIPINNATNPINGKIVCNIVSTASRPPDKSINHFTSLQDRFSLRRIYFLVLLLFP